MNLIPAIICCLIASFLLSGLESALFTLSRVQLRHQAKEGNRKAERLENILDRRQQVLISMLVLNTAVNLSAFAMLTRLTVDHFGQPGYLVAFLLSLPVYLVWIELLPNSLFKNLPIPALLRFLPLLIMIDAVARPLIAVPRFLLSLFSGNKALAGSNSSALARDEFRMLTDIMDRDGVFKPGEKTMIHQVLDFQRLPIHKVMLPLTRVTAVPMEMPVSSVLDLARETDFSQFPVISAKGDLVGLIDVLELLQSGEKEGKVRDYLRKLVLSSPDDRAIDVLRTLRETGLGVAMVRNRKGRPLGIVSVDDMVARLIEPAR